MQSILRSDGTDKYSGENSHRFVESKRNQRIEAWWSFYRRNRSTWWINFFKDLVERGIFLYGNEYHKEYLWFCFSQLLQEDLQLVKAHWNTHYILQSRFNTVAGIPDVLYYLPELSGHSEHLVELEQSEMNKMEEHCIRLNEEDEENVYHSYSKYVLNTEGLSMPSTWQQALKLYECLITVGNV